MSALVMSPGQLRVAARTLGQESGTLRSVSRGTRGGADAGASWTGLAALAQQADEESWARILDAVCDPLEGLSGLVSGFADEVEEAQTTVRRWLTRQEDLAREVLDLQRLIASADDLVRPVLERQLTQARELLEQARQRVADVEDVLRRTADRVAAEVSDSWPVRALGELRWLREVSRAGQNLWQSARQALLTTGIVRDALAAARAVTVQGRAVLLARARDAVLVARALHLSGKGGLKLLPRVGGKLGVSLSFMVSGVGDLVTGGGYDDWRGTVTRVLGGLAIPASVGIWVPALPVFAASAGVLAAYTAWTAGNVLYDNRAKIARVVRAAPTAARMAARTIDERYRLSERARLTGVVAKHLGSAAKDSVTSGAETAWNFTKDHLNPLPDLEEGPGIRVDVPVLPWLRVPVNVPLPDLDAPQIEVPDIKLPDLDWGDLVNPPWVPSGPFSHWEELIKDRPIDELVRADVVGAETP